MNDTIPYWQRLIQTDRQVMHRAYSTGAKADWALRFCFVVDMDGWVRRVIEPR